jgi:hypothetical protein
MPTLVAQIAPQRSTQYTTLVETLAPKEILLSPLGKQIDRVQLVALGNQTYLQFDLQGDLDQGQLEELGLLAMADSFFLYFQPTLPATMITARRYRGKTNELFTHFLCNVARFSSALSHRPWSTLRVFDPLSGGGTTLFTALVLGASAAGVEHIAGDVESTATFIKQFTKEQGIPCQEKKERLKTTGRRWWFTIGKQNPQTCVLAHGDTADSAALISGFRPHFVVADLPYGIQHQGQLDELLTRALPIWASLLPPSGAMVLAWESQRFSRAHMIDVVESTCPLAVINDPPYDALAHRVDRVIKQRDILVARPANSFPEEGESAEASHARGS